MTKKKSKQPIIDISDEPQDMDPGAGQQKPAGSVLQNHALQDQSEEDMMQAIIDSKGRKLYELMYKVADKYRLERFKEAT